MNCRQVRGLFSARFDNELGGKDGAQFERHLQVCGACADQWASFSRTVQLVRTLPPVTPDPAFVGHVLDRVRAYEAGHTEVSTESAGWVSIRLRAARDFFEDFSWSSVLFPARLAGALALGAFLGFVATDRLWSPSLPGQGRPVLLSSAADQVTPGRISGGQAVSSRPFADLVPQLASIRPDGRTGDSTITDPNLGIPAPGSVADPQGQQVRLSVLGGRPQVTF